MANIKVDFNKIIDKIKPMHGIGQPPFMGTDFSLFHYLREANIPFSRLHDVGGRYGGGVYVDIPNIFRDFSADESLPSSYDFAFTDTLITALAENEVEPFFRLGVTIENYQKIKAYNIYPPADFNKWARICEHIILHYTKGWASGFNYDIRYWEIWNEPDNEMDAADNIMWKGTKEQYYELYDIASKHLKNKFPHLKIGGYASCGFYAITKNFIASANSSPRTEYFLEFFDGFLNYIKEHNSPLDFFSWHSYDDFDANIRYANYARQRLDEIGLHNTETICNEWNFEHQTRGSMFHASRNTAMLIAFQHTPLDSSMFYDARVGGGSYGALFHPLEYKPYPLYYGFKAYGSLYALENEVESESDNKDIFALAAGKGNKGGALIVNIGEASPINFNIIGAKIISCKIIDENNSLEEIPIPQIIAKDTILYIETEN